MKHSKTQLAVVVGAALLAGAGVAQAQQASSVMSGQPLQVTLYGQVNRALMFADNDAQSKIFHVDGQPSSTRIGIQGTGQIMPGLRAGARFETEMKSNPSNEVTFAAPSQGALSGDAVGFAERWLDAHFEGAWGRVNIGQGSGAADDASTIDLSGTGIANGVAISDWAGAIPFTGAGAGGLTPGAVLDNFDFESRYDRVMYATPVLGGLRAQVGFGQRNSEGEATEASLWYTGKLGGDLQAAIGWSRVNLAPNDRETIGGSVSWLHTSGFNVTAAYTTRDLGGASTRDAEHWYAKLGYKFRTHAISLAYFQGDDQATAGDEANAYALGYVWNPIRFAEIYANYIIYSMDRSAGDVNDINVATIGTRIRF